MGSSEGEGGAAPAKCLAVAVDLLHHAPGIRALSQRLEVVILQQVHDCLHLQHALRVVHFMNNLISSDVMHIQSLKSCKSTVSRQVQTR